MKDTINNFYIKCKLFARFLQQRDIFIALLMLGVAFGSFGLGFLAGKDNARLPMTIGVASRDISDDKVAAVGATAPTAEPRRAGEFVASKNGSSYHYPWCPGAERIKEENKIWFDSREKAEVAGYRAATNCKGL